MKGPPFLHTSVLTYIPCIPTKLSLGVGSHSVDYRKSDRKVNQITMKYNLMRLRCGLPIYTIN